MSNSQPTQPASRSTGGLVAQVAIGTAVAGLAMGLLGASIAVSTGSESAGIVIRGLLALVIVLLICRIFGARARQAGIARPTLLVGAGALLGFLVNPLTWGGRTALTQLVADPGPATVAGDLVLWLLVAGLGAQWGASRAPAPTSAATPYG